MSGLGFVFTAIGAAATLRRRVVMFAYRVLFASRRVRVIFENNDDRQMFLKKGVVAAEQANVIRGVGVDTQRFAARPEPSGVPLVILPARMLWDKGVREFCEAAEALRAAGVNARFALIGPLDPENPSAVPEHWLDEQVRGGAVEWWGHQSDMIAIYAQATVVCLPSYREGLPTVLLEAGASGCVVVTTDVPGCREVVSNGETGVLVPDRDSSALAAALKNILTDPELRERLSTAARRYVTAEFSGERTMAKTLQLYRALLR
jgi:glycosyltransferase involved in cell wall biosynthesis